VLTLPLITLNADAILWSLLFCTLVAAAAGGRTWLGRKRCSVSEAERLAERRADNLAKILDIANTMNTTLDLDRLLTGIARAVRESLGFRMVLVRLLDEETGTFKARSFAGLDDASVAKLRQHEVPLEEFERLMRDEFRMGPCYFISHEAQYWDRNDERLVIPDLGERCEGEWHPLDSLFVPLQTRDRRLIGYLSVDDPADRQVPSRETIEILEIFSTQAVVAIENAQLYSDLEAKIDELRWMTARLEESHETRNAFMANVSHELRTPLTSIRAYLDTVISEVRPKLKSQHAHFLNVILEETLRLTGLVDDLLSFSKMEAGKIRLNRETVHVHDLVREALSVVAAEAEQKGLTLVEDLGDVEPIPADRDRVAQLLMNLLGNALKFTDYGGRITARVREEEDGVRLEVEDTGIGISGENLERVFERFYQTDGSSTRKYGGVGLGLAICRGIVEQHGGRIWAESEEGAGSLFVAWLPRRGEPSEPPAPAERRRVPEQIVRLVAEVMQSKSASIMLMDEEKPELFVETATGLDPLIIRNARVRVGDDISGWVAENRRPLLICDIEEDERFGRKNRSTYESKSLLSVPLTLDNRIIGVLNVTNKVSCTPFTKDDTRLLASLADRLTRILNRMAEVEDPAGVLPPTQVALQAIIDARRRRGDGDTGTMREMLAGTCTGLGMDKAEVEIMKYIADIYDVGMTRVEESILSKPGPLEPGDVEKIRSHPQVGVDLLSPIEFLDQVREIILHHHEWYDGRGYPGGLAGRDIPLGARVLAVLDAFQSMTTHRPYRQTRSPEQALGDIRRCAGTQFDPDVVRIFTEVWKEIGVTRPPLESGARVPVALRDVPRERCIP